MRAALLVIAGLALVGFIAVSFILPGMAGSEAKEAAKKLVDGAEAAKQQVAAAGNAVDPGHHGPPRSGIGPRLPCGARIARP